MYVGLDFMGFSQKKTCTYIHVIHTRTIIQSKFSFLEGEGEGEGEGKGGEGFLLVV